MRILRIIPTLHIKQQKRIIRNIIDTDAVFHFFGGAEEFKSLHDNQFNYYYSVEWPSSKLE